MSRPWPGAFIALEGIDGSGTTTQALRLIQRLRQEGHDAVSAREPTDGPVGTLLRGLLAQNPSVQDGSRQGPGWEMMALLFAADRADHVQRLLQPSLAEGRVVVSDRFDLSSRIYQSLTSPDPERALPWVCSLNHRFPRPDLTLVLDIDEEVAAERRASRGGPRELFENTALQQRLAEAYRRAEDFVPGDRIEHLDGAASADDLAQAVYASVRVLLSGR